MAADRLRPGCLSPLSLSSWCVARQQKGLAGKSRALKLEEEGLAHLDYDVIIRSLSRTAVEVGSAGTRCRGHRVWCFYSASLFNHSTDNACVTDGNKNGFLQRDFINTVWKQGLCWNTCFRSVWIWFHLPLNINIIRFIKWPPCI